jgi:hypothetical protein
MPAGRAKVRISKGPSNRSYPRQEASKHVAQMYADIEAAALTKA